MHDALDDGLTNLVLINIPNQFHIQFDQVGLDFSKQVQACITGAEIINGRFEAALLVVLDNATQVGEVVDLLIFREFKKMMCSMGKP